MSLIRADPEEMEKTKMEKRVFLIVLDSFGIGAEPDAAAFGDEGTNTLGAIAKHPNFNCPNLQKLGLFNIDGVTAGEKTAAPELQSLCVSDEYFADEYIFDILGGSVTVRNERLAKALQSLTERKRDIILLSYFLDMTDREIAEKLNMVRKTVQYQRTSSLKALKKRLEDSSNEQDDNK